MRRVAGAVAFLVTLLLPIALTVVPAQAAMHHWYGKVKKVQDGDTVYVKIKGDGLKRAVPIRNSGIQAIAKTECHGIAARTVLRSYLKKGDKVRLSAKHKNSTAGHDPKGRLRLWRYIDKWDKKTHTWVDVQRLLLLHGDVMWLAHTSELSRVSRYHGYMQQAAAKHVGLWDNDYCGSGPSQSANLRAWLNYDANGSDAKVKNGEWMRVQNRGSGDVSIGGWRLRMAHNIVNSSAYTIPSGAVVRAGDTVTFYFGSGTNDAAAGRFYLGMQNTQFLANVADPRLGYPGKSIYLLDPQYDFRALADYPCLASCAPLPDVTIASVDYASTSESVTLRAGSTSADLSGVVVENDGWTKEIAPGTVLQAGQSLKVWCDNGGTDQTATGSATLNQYWGPASWDRGTTMLENAGDTVVLRTAQSQVIDKYFWGSR